MKLVLITGMSGAGKSIALKTLEDAGFEAIDNIPLAFLPAIAGAQDAAKSLAVGADARSRDFSMDQFLQAIEPLKNNPAIDLKIVFLECDDEALRRRYTETRRRHPLALDRPVLDGIRLERSLIGGLRDHADFVIDTSELHAADLKRIVSTHFAEAKKSLTVSVLSFSFRRGLPREADMVFDARFLKNPHYDPALQPLSGTDTAVGNYIADDRDFKLFFERLQALLVPLLPRFLEEGKSYLTLAVGCTGGRHRSVFVAEQLGAFVEGLGYGVTVRHRDKDVKSEAAHG